MATEEDVELPVLAAPAGGLPTVVAADDQLASCLRALTAGSGAVALDVERAQSYRYSGKAYLLQLRRAGSGTFLIDPVAFETLPNEIAQFTELQQLIGDQEWILHAASQDLPNLIALGLRPTRLFDTELAGRLLGLPRVSLGSMAERYCGVRLLKEHASVDWSTRPIPDDWLTYAALDVELLDVLRARLLDDLIAAGKAEWAQQEFNWLIQSALRPAPDQLERWRRTSGTHLVRSSQGLAIVRELWLVRDQIAKRTDRAPGKVLPDRAISELGALVTKRHAQVPGRAELDQIAGFKRRTARRYQDAWLAALDRVANMPASALPSLRLAGDGIPAPRTWERIKPAAAARWDRVRPAMLELAEELQVPMENLIQPEALRQLLWDPNRPATVSSLEEQLADLGVRPWQRSLVAPLAAELIA